ncbi:outer membrane lipoprotein-sorting protein [Aliiroseovarius crassostreae]|uniref:outer membrane lipoprotein-sorting protein n=1 Tax=Aliiroseovarius crassostreae TaxID=154981 RepID=UPI00220A5AC1|nr:outer membrane lipoprotein-sorting protein [Aliiroseovarius crassostreae]UWP90883.1 outer membrane lipoprotein-sorting protein [Aliiroseovarius crassostreae]
MFTKINLPAMALTAALLPIFGASTANAEGDVLLAPATPTSPVLTTCRDVMEGVQNRYNGYDSWRIVHMEITDETGAIKTRRIAAAHRNDGINRKLRSHVFDPEELANVQSFVRDSFEEGVPDRVWLHVPSAEKNIEVKSEDLSQRLYGSDLAVGEMLIRQADDYDCKMLGTDVYLNYPIYKIYVNPRTEDEVIRLGLRDGELWVDTETFMPLYSSFNADAPNEQRVLETLNLRWVDGVFAPEHYRVSTIKEGRVVSFSNFHTEGERFNIGLPAEWFSLDDLGRAESGFKDFRSTSIASH